ncbi:flagellar hook-associated protein 2 [Litchfieldia salsa]|uniref:Flagellar hook-associated protein 2 n=1 Tax=Litchfieldia salsa TaxID=930152 RepID=A0A1H0WDZ8_9BACI|nr:flagellar hook-associated protein 2 [Litchfieldia salsa]SDP88715.1 flagellar hook-associated protein 2 [Litchfieldia salsa]
MRIGGLASGMDIDTLVLDLMKAQRIPLTKLTQKKQVFEWQRDDYRSMNTLLKDLDNHIFSGVYMAKNLMQKAATSSNSSVVTATANASASSGTTNFTDVKLATSARWLSDKTMSTGDLTPAATTISLSVTAGDGSQSTPVEQTLTFESTDTIDDIIKKLNGKKEYGISAIHENGKVSITKNDTGSQASIVINDQATADFFTSLGFTAQVGQELGYDAGTNTNTVKTLGENATFAINGILTERSSNTFDLNNVTYSLKGAGSATITVTNDTDSVIDNIVSFIDKYNDVIGKINAKTSEERYKSYNPLSSEEREAMSDKQADLWEEKAKSGLLRRDSILSTGLNKMRNSIYNSVSVSATENYQLAEFGITTSRNYLDRGKLEYDKEKLKAAIEENPEAIYKLFMNDSTTESSQGIIRRLRGTIKETMTNIEAKAGKTLSTNQQYSIGRNLSSINSQITRFEDRLIQVEDRYWRQFTAMEKAIQQSNNQSAFLMQQFSY